jgi:hypothetical protein
MYSFTDMQQKRILSEDLVRLQSSTHSGCSTTQTPAARSPQNPILHQAGCVTAHMTATNETFQAHNSNNNKKNRKREKKSQKDKPSKKRTS